jgi:hypothetical protein
VPSENEYSAFVYRLYSFLFQKAKMQTTSNITGSTITQGSVTDTCTKTDIKRPFLFRYRSSNLFVFWTAAVGLFTSVSEVVA